MIFKLKQLNGPPFQHPAIVNVNYKYDCFIGLGKMCQLTSRGSLDIFSVGTALVRTRTPVEIKSLPPAECTLVCSHRVKVGSIIPVKPRVVLNVAPIGDGTAAYEERNKLVHTCPSTRRRSSNF
jgi:hypothetical protein